MGKFRFLIFTAAVFFAGAAFYSVKIYRSTETMGAFSDACKYQGAPGVTIAIEHGMFFDSVSVMCTIPNDKGSINEPSVL